MQRGATLVRNPGARPWCAALVRGVSDGSMPPMTESSAPQPWKVLKRTTLVHDKWISLHAEQVRTGRGVVLDPFYVLDERSWACAIPVLPDGRVVVVEQYRHGSQSIGWEWPAGDIDAGEDVEVTAAREVLEETGYVARGPARLIGAWFPEPARNRSCGHAFVLPVDAQPQHQDLDAGEDIQVRVLTLAELESAIAKGRFVHAVHVAAWYAARSRGLL